MSIDKNLIDELVEVIYQRIDEKFKTNLNHANVEFSHTGIVGECLEDNDGNVISADVELSFSLLRQIPNRSGEILASGDKVKIFYDKTNMSNAYIGVKL